MGLSTTFQEYSEFEIKDFAIKFQEDMKHAVCGAVGSCEESLETKTVKKKYKGIESKTRTRGTGTGELKLSIHMAYEAYLRVYGMKDEDLVDGVYAYGQNSLHPTFSLTEKVEDEDGVLKYKAYPNCTIKEGIARKIENGGEEVAEIDMTVSVMPDIYGVGMYEMIVSETTKEIADKWLEDFTPDMVRTKTA